MKQHTCPVLINDKSISSLEKVSLDTGFYNEDWIQDICFRSPNLLPVEELEPSFGGMVPICREMATESGSIDLVYVNKDGFITIGECKLWRNPEARRKVVGQVLDYAKDLSKWDYSKFEIECLKARKGNVKSLFEIIHEFYPDTEEASFCDNLQRNLEMGRFLLTIIGDGIRGNMEELAKYIHRNGNLNFTLCLVEMPVYRNPATDDLVITPRILAKTIEIERIIYKLKDADSGGVISPPNVDPPGVTISEKVFYERLEKAIGTEYMDRVKKLVADLKSEFNIRHKLGRGNRLSLNLKSANEKYNFASIQEDGEVQFYGIVSKTEELGDKQIGVEYLERLARIVGGNLDKTYSEWQWCVKKNNKYLGIKQYLEVKNQWFEIIGKTMDKINKLEDSD